MATTLLLTACLDPDLAPDQALVEVQEPQPVIYDSDMAHEDMIAALFLLSHPNVDLRAITVAGTGEAHCKPGGAPRRGSCVSRPVAASGRQRL